MTHKPSFKVTAFCNGEYLNTVHFVLSNCKQFTLKIIAR